MSARERFFLMRGFILGIATGGAILAAITGSPWTALHWLVNAALAFVIPAPRRFP